MTKLLDSTLVLCDLDHLLLAGDGNMPQVVRDVLQLFSSRGGRLTGFVEANLGRSKTDRKKMAVYPASEPHTKYAYTGYKVLERFGGFTLLECRLKTGRTHQIRVHMASIQHPVAGDPVYGPHNCITRLHGQCLHAKTLGFIHPITGEHLRFDSELPEYFTHFIASLRRGTV